MLPHSTLTRTLRAAFLLSMLGTAAADDSLCEQKPGERLRAHVVPAAEVFAPGVEVRAELEIESLGAAAALRVVTEGVGILASAEQVTLLDGPWSAGARTAFAIALRPIASRAGTTGELRVRVFALDDFGATIQGRATVLHAVADARGTWVSSSSATDAALRRLGGLRAAGALGAREHADQLHAVSRGAAVTDHRTRTARPLAPAEARLERALGAPDGPSPDPRGGAFTIVVGHVEWTDGAGGTHGLPMADVELRDGSTVLGTASTNAAGDYAVVLTEDDPIVASLRVYARSSVGDIKPDAVGAVTYFADSTTLNVSGGGVGTLNLTIGNTTSVENAFSVHAALALIGGYTSSLTGGLPSQIDVFFPTTQSTSLFRSTARELHILMGDRFDWDVIHHEYGHYVMNVHGFVMSPGGAHQFNRNLSANPGRDKDSGGRLAWGEGWPTFFGTVGQERMGGASLGIPGVGDTVYTDGEDVDPPFVVDIEAQHGVGEDDELSIMSALWDLYDTEPDGLDDFSTSDLALFQAFKNDGVVRMGEAWSAVAEPMELRHRTAAGAVLAQATIAPELTTPPDRYTPSPTPPVFRWKANGGGMPNPLNDFKIVFYDREFTASFLEIELGNRTDFTPTQPQWDAIRAADEVVHWVIEGKNTTSPVTAGGALGTYWSQARSIGGIGIAFVIDDTESMTEEIAGVQLALQLFIDELESELGPGESPPTIQVVTFKDDVTERIVSSDLDAVRGVVNALVASGGNDCPEEGALAVQFAGASLTTDGILFIATDAAPQPGVDLETAISELEAKGVSVQVLLSGDCVDIESAREPGPAWIGAAGPVLGERLVLGGAQSGASSSHGPEHQKPGDDDPAQGPISDPGQNPIDDHGDTTATATLLRERAAPTFGYASAIDSDFFALDVEAGLPYAIRFHSTGANPVTVRLVDVDETTVIRFVSTSTTNLIAFVPLSTGRHYVRMSTIGANYDIRFQEDPYPLLLTAQEVYSTLAAETGGVFSLQDGVNDGEITEYVSSLFNIMVGTIRPTVILANPNDLPQGSDFTLSLTGNRTNWSADTTVDVLATGVTVNGVEVASATELQVALSIEAGASLGFADVVVSTPIGADVEMARGVSVVEVTDAIAVPTALTMQPTGAQRGATIDVALFGVATAWDASSTLDLGTGVVIDSVTTLSATRLDARITLDANTPIGFRRATVSTNGKVDDALDRALFVFGARADDPRIRDVSPLRAGRGARVIVTVETEDATLTPGVTTADFGPGVLVVSVDVITPRRAEVTVEIAVGAPLGFRDVTLTTGGETLVEESGFFVDDFTGVRTLDAGLAKFSDSLDPYGSRAFEFDALAGDTLTRVFVVPFGDGTNGSVAAPDADVTVVAPSGSVVWSARATGAPVDGIDLALPESGTYRLTILDRGGSGGAYKGIAFIE